ncbi:MAG TPA: hypothetical protein VMD05_08950, partial [Candidatus Nanoarchaeia archaeon]|nr:hypothetical protein [Candidatus Nanoarchaeia archaeon]
METKKIKTRNKMLSALALILLLTFPVAMLTLPVSTAHSPPWQIPTFAYTVATPNPVGVGQTAIISMWLTNIFPSELIGNDYRFHNFQLTITAPDGTVAVKTSFATATPDSFISY